MDVEHYSPLIETGVSDPHLDDGEPPCRRKARQVAIAAGIQRVNRQPVGLGSGQVVEVIGGSERCQQTGNDIAGTQTQQGSEYPYQGAGIHGKTRDHSAEL